MRTETWRSIAFATLGFFTASAKAQDFFPAGLSDLFEKRENLSDFRSYLSSYPEVFDGIKELDGFTLLAPDNEAMAKIPLTALNKIFDRNETDGIIAALRYHILKGTRKTSDLTPGILYGVPTLLESEEFTNVTGGQRVTNVKQSEDVVVFISGLGSRCEVSEKDVELPGGIVQVITTPVIFPLDLVTTTTSYNLTGFQGALFATNRTEEISEKKSITIFAPTNEAFQALGPAISNMTAKQLSTILDYHILPKLVYSQDIINNATFTTTQGKNLTVKQIGNQIYINSAQLLTKDILIANGVIHVLDNVLNPKNKGPAPDPNKYVTQPVVFSSASEVGSVPFTTAIPCSEDCPVTTGGETYSDVAPTGSSTGFGNGAGNGVQSTSSRAWAPRETGFVGGGVGLLGAVVGGAVLMI